MIHNKKKIKKTVLFNLHYRNNYTKNKHVQIQ